jgi:hypothetical protein
MLAVFLAVTMLASSPTSPVCYQGVIGDGARQRRLIVEMRSETTATAHLYTRPGGIRHHRNDDRHDRAGFAHGLVAPTRTHTSQVRRFA